MLLDCAGNATVCGLRPVVSLRSKYTSVVIVVKFSKIGSVFHASVPSQLEDFARVQEYGGASMGNEVMPPSRLIEAAWGMASC